MELAFKPLTAIVLTAIALHSGAAFTQTADAATGLKVSVTPGPH